jgi:hypothetical protein
MLSDTLYSKSIRGAILTRKRIAFAISRLRKVLTYCLSIAGHKDAVVGAC